MQVIGIDGKCYAVINSLTNSVYTVICNPVEFAVIVVRAPKHCSYKDYSAFFIAYLQNIFDYLLVRLGAHKLLGLASIF